MKHGILICAATLALALVSNAASAKDLPAGGMTINDLVNWLQGQGYKAEVQTAKDGSKNIYSAAEGSNFHIYQYDCKNGRCGSLQFSVGFDTKGSFGPGPMNDWNRDNRWARAYVDKVNDPWLEYDVDLAPGGTFEMLNDEFGIWRDTLGRFHKIVDK